MNTASASDDGFPKCVNVFTVMSNATIGSTVRSHANGLMSRFVELYARAHTKSGDSQGM